MSEVSERTRGARHVRHVLVAGCGYVGIALARRLVAEGAHVAALRRDPSKLPVDLLRPDTHVCGIAIDLDEPASLARLPERIDQVVYAASPGGGDDARYEATYVRHVATLIDFLVRRGDPVTRFAITTSTGVYAQTDGAWVDEGSETTPTHHSGMRMLEGERLVQTAPFSAPYAGIAVRLAGIYGPERTSLVARVARGEARTPRAPTYTNRIHRDDCAGVLAHVLSVAAPEPIYVGVDREPAELGTVQTFLAERLGVPAPPLEDDEAAAAVGRRARSNKRCRSRHLDDHPFAFPTFREGYADIVATWQQHP